MAIRWPTATSLTAVPTLTTVPVASWPLNTRKRYVYFSSKIFFQIPGIKGIVPMTLATSFHKYRAISDPQMATFSTLKRTSSSSMVGTGTSFNSYPSEAFSLTKALIFWGREESIFDEKASLSGSSLYDVGGQMITLSHSA